MLRVKELHELAATLSPGEFQASVGPFVLIERPPSALFVKIATTLQSSRTVAMSKRSRLTEEILAMVTGFGNMRVQKLPGLSARTTLVVGRLEECEINVQDPSVSKKHAVLVWEPSRTACSVKDLGSTNGTYVNAAELSSDEVELSDGDTLCFGDALFLYMLAPTLHAQLRTIPAPRP